MNKRFRLTLIGTAACLLIGLVGCSADNGTTATTAATVKTGGTSSASASRTVWETIGAADAKARMDASSGHLLVDVRTPDEFVSGHIPDAVNIEYETIVSGMAARGTPKDQEIFVYCRTGRRSAIAAEALAKAGYTRVVDFGGIEDWSYDTVKGAA